MSSAAPVAEHSFVSGPHRRGTVDLVSSCLFTIFLAVYAALHLNVEESAGWCGFQAKKLRWVCLAMVWPEFVIWTAFSQLEVAYEVNRFVKDNKDNKYQRQGVNVQVQVRLLQTTADNRTMAMDHGIWKRVSMR
jgi:hypothetical protein